MGKRKEEIQARGGGGKNTRAYVKTRVKLCQVLSNKKMGSQRISHVEREKKWETRFTSKEEEQISFLKSKNAKTLVRFKESRGGGKGKKSYDAPAERKVLKTVHGATGRARTKEDLVSYPRGDAHASRVWDNLGGGTKQIEKK